MSIYSVDLQTFPTCFGTGNISTRFQGQGIIDYMLFFVHAQTVYCKNLTGVGLLTAWVVYRLSLERKRKVTSIWFFTMESFQKKLEILKGCPGILLFCFFHLEILNGYFRKHLYLLHMYGERKF